jgi:hypothetical protein
MPETLTIAAELHLESSWLELELIITPMPNSHRDVSEGLVPGFSSEPAASNVSMDAPASEGRGT